MAKVSDVLRKRLFPKWSIAWSSVRLCEVIIVGWGADSTGDYWLIRNSWGADWADAGHAKFSQPPRTPDRPARINTGKKLCNYDTIVNDFNLHLSCSGVFASLCSRLK